MDKITLTIGELVSLAQTGVLAKFLTTPKPIKISWENRKIGPTADTELKAYNEKRLELLKEVGATLPEGTKEYIFPRIEALEKFKIEHDELLAQTIELPGVPVSFTDLKGDLSESDLNLLEKFIKD